MKPHLLPARWTVEDFDVVWLVHIARREPFAWHGTHLAYIEADRRDADLMLGLWEFRAQGDTFLRIGPANYLVPPIHVMVRKNPLWPDQQ
jgi:hypothetical protein